MKLAELKKLAREKLASGMTKQEAFETIVSMNVIRIHDIANVVRDIASNFFKQKYKRQNYLLIGLIILAGMIQGLSSVLFQVKDLSQNLPSDIFLFLTYAAISVGVSRYFKLSFSAAIFLSIISIYMSVQNILIAEQDVMKIGFYGIVILIGLAIIGLSSILYSKYFRGYDIKTDSEKRETYSFKEEK